MDYAYVHLTGSRIISSLPCCLDYIIVTSDGAGVADITLYEGESEQDDKVVTIKALSGHTQPIDFPYSLCLNKGLYVSVGSNVGSVMAIYHYYNE